MRTELKISLSSKDCKEIFKDLKPLIENTCGLSPKLYLLYNKIKFFDVAYSDIEDKE